MTIRMNADEIRKAIAFYAERQLGEEINEEGIVFADINNCEITNLVSAEMEVGNANRKRAIDS